MTNEWQDYVNDPRVVCKYGLKCYQKNPEHHSKYKHPPKLHLKNKRGNRNDRRFSPYKRDTPRASAEAETNNDSREETSTNNDNKNIDNNDLEINSDNEATAVSYGDELTTTSDNKTDTTNEASSSTKLTNKDDTPEKINETDDMNLLYYDSTDHKILQKLFLIEMPQDFFKFYECLNDDNCIEKTLSAVNLELIGPFDLLRGKLPIVNDKELYLVHWRFFYDPPEFQAVLKKKGKSEYHIGYFRDSPNEKPVFLASNDSSKDYHIKPMAENIFAAVYQYLQNEKKASPFTSVACQRLMDKVKKHAENNNYSLDMYNMKKRQAKIVTKTFHGAGIVVPYDKKTQLGYRHLVESDATIRKMFSKLQEAKSQSEKDSVLSELQPVITYASIALDECDFGTSIEAGIALFCSGLKELEPSAQSSLTAAYSLLNREAFGKIIQAHFKHRRKGSNLSLLSMS